MRGIVKTKVDDRGFGFITPEGKGKDVFFHVSGCQDGDEAFAQLRPGDNVEFEVEQSPRGPRAAGLKIAG